MLSLEEEMKLSRQEQIDYYNLIRKELKDINPKKMNYTKNVQKIYGKLFKFLRKYSMELYGEENLPQSNAVFICNHSNSHDFYTIQEVFQNLGRRVSVLSASDCLNKPSQFLFSIADSVLIDRNDKYSCFKGEKELVRKIINGFDAFVFSESTWNLHPYRKMLPSKWGASYISIKAGAPVVPTIFEYIEVPDICDNEFEMYKKCIVFFGEPIYIEQNANVASITKLIENKMIQMRIQIQASEKILKESLDDVDTMLYLNHTYLKKNTPLFKLDADYESQFILKENNQRVENEFELSKEGILVPRRVIKKF